MDLLWMLGKSASERAVRDALKAADWTRGEVDVAAIGGIGVTMAALDGGGDKRVLGLAMRVLDVKAEEAQGTPLFTGELPFGMLRGDSREALRAKFGQPVSIEQPPYGGCDIWRIEGKQVAVVYTKAMQILIVSIGIAAEDMGPN